MKGWAREDLVPARSGIAFTVSVGANSLTPQRILETQGRTCVSEELRGSPLPPLIEGNPKAWTKNSLV